jgi:GNAT superfamily N-acetyltransferase
MAKPQYEQEKSVANERFLVSNNNELISHDFIHKAFASEQLYWAKDVSPQALSTMLEFSCTLGLYSLGSTSETANPEQPSALEPTQIGFARLITDYATFAYLTDVNVLPSHQGKGLGKWLISCCKEIIDSMPALRGALLLTSLTGKGVKFYEKELGMKLVDEYAVMLYKKV